MRLIIGGAHQGKLGYALSDTGLTKRQVTDGVSCPLESTSGVVVLSNFQQLVKRLLKEGCDPGAYVEALLSQSPNTIIISDEIGCGVVPMDAFERAWREAAGRQCCVLAQRADRVDRVFCGLAQTIKGAGL